MVPNGAHDKLAGGGLNGALAHLVEVRRAEVAGHDDDRVAEVDDAPLTVRQPAVVEDLEEELVELPRGLLDLVDEDDRVRLAANVLRELTALVVADVARGSTDETRNRVLLRVLRAVDTDHGVRGVKENGCELREKSQLQNLTEKGGNSPSCS